MTFHLSQLLPQVDLIHTCDNNICHKGINGHIPHGNNICQTLVVNKKLTITSVIILIHVDLTSVNIISVDYNISQHNNNKFGIPSKNSKNSKIIKYNIPETPSTMGVFGSITFSHTPEEAMSGGLAKACVPTKINPVEEKLSFLMNIKQDEKSTFLYH